MWIDRWSKISGALLCVALVLPGCEDATGPEDATDRQAVGSIVIEASRTELEIGESVQLRATVLDRTGVVMTGRSVTWDSSDPTVASVDEGGTLTALAAGPSLIRARSGGGTGSLPITVRAGPCTPESVSGTVASGDVVEGTLSPSDCILLEGPYADALELELHGPSLVRIGLASASFDAVVLLTDADFELFVGFDDDGGQGSDALLVQSLAAGRYILWVTSYGPGQTGEYRLSVAVREAASCSTPVGSVAVGQTVTGTLDLESCTTPSAGLTHPWRFESDGATAVEIDLRSDVFDTVLRVTDASGDEIAWNDDSGGTLNSRLLISPPAGDYTIWVASYGGRGTGAYELSVRAAPEGAATPPENSSRLEGRKRRPGPPWLARHALQSRLRGTTSAISTASAGALPGRYGTPGEEAGPVRVAAPVARAGPSDHTRPAPYPSSPPSSSRAWVEALR